MALASPHPDRHRPERLAAALLAVAIAAYVLIQLRTTPRVTLPAQDLPQIQIDPNTARWEDLAALPVVGEQSAKRIIAYRQQQQAKGIAAPYQKPQDLDPVEGIGPRILEQLTPYLRFPATQP